MSIIPDYINKAIGRLNEFLPEKAVITPIREVIERKIPFGLAGAYDFYEAEILGEHFLLVGIDGNDVSLPPTVVAKQRDALQRMTELTPIFIFNSIASYIFPRYAKKSLNIIVADKQLFLPDIFLIANKEKVTSTIQEPKVPGLFQLLVLFNLERESTDGLTTRDVAEKFNVSYATVNRCVRWMNNFGFISLTGVKEKRIGFLFKGKELWQKALPFLDNPIDFIVYTSEPIITDKFLLSEQSALAEYTMLNEGPRRIAISRETFVELRNQEIDWNQFGELGVEVWKYDPMLLSDSGIVDKLSLYLILKGHSDERVQIELENMINEITW